MQQTAPRFSEIDTYRTTVLDIKPGVYRVKFEYNSSGTIGVRRHEEDLVSALNRIRKTDMCIELPRKWSYPEVIKKNDKIVENTLQRTFFKSIEEFIETWMRGYREGRSQFGYGAEEKLGFVLEAFDLQGTRLEDNVTFENGIIHLLNPSSSPSTILVDTNTSSTDTSRLELIVRDIPQERVLSYCREGENTDLTYNNPPEKQLIVREEIPSDFRSICRDLQQTHFTLLGYNSDQVYRELEEKFGFKFPQEN